MRRRQACQPFHLQGRYADESARKKTVWSCRAFLVKESISFGAPRQAPPSVVPAVTPPLAGTPVDADDSARLPATYPMLHEPEVFLPLMSQLRLPLWCPDLWKLEGHRVPGGQVLRWSLEPKKLRWGCCRPRPRYGRTCASRPQRAARGRGRPPGCRAHREERHHEDGQGGHQRVQTRLCLRADRAQCALASLGRVLRGRRPPSGLCGGEDDVEAHPGPGGLDDPAVRRGYVRGLPLEVLHQ